MSDNLTRFHIRITREPGDPTYNLNIVGMYRSENDARQIWQSIISSRYLGNRAEVDLVREMTSPFSPLPADANNFDEHGNPRPDVAPPGEVPELSTIDYQTAEERILAAIGSPLPAAKDGRTREQKAADYAKAYGADNATVARVSAEGGPRKPLSATIVQAAVQAELRKRIPDTLTAEMERRAKDMLPPIEEIQRKPSRSSADLALDGIKAEVPGTIVGRLAPEEGEARRMRLHVLGYRVDQSGKPLPSGEASCTIRDGYPPELQDAFDKLNAQRGIPNAELPGTAEHDRPADAPIASVFQEPHVPPQPPTAHKGDFATIPAGFYNFRIVRLLAIGIELEIISPGQYFGRRFVMSPDEFNSADWGGDSIRLRRPYPVLPSKIKRQVVVVSGLMSQQENIRAELDKVAREYGLVVRFD